MITVARDRNPPVEMPAGKCWRWTAAVTSPVGYTASMQGWLAGSKREAREAAEAAEKRLNHAHCSRVRWHHSELHWEDPEMNRGRNFRIKGAQRREKRA